MSLSFHTSPIPIILRLPRGLWVKVKTKELKTRVSISDTRFGHSVSQLWWKAQSLHWHDSIQLHDSIHQTFCCRWKLCLKYYTLWRLFFLLLQWFLSLSCHTLSPRQIKYWMLKHCFDIYRQPVSLAHLDPQPRASSNFPCCMLHMQTDWEISLQVYLSCHPSNDPSTLRSIDLQYRMLHWVPPLGIWEIHAT